MPPALRNHRDPTGADTPQASAASSLDNPPAIFVQNRRSSSRRTGGRPGDRIGGLPVAAAAQPGGRPIHTSVLEVLRRPVESAEYTARAFQAACQRLSIAQSMGRPGSALDNAVIESWHSTLEFELRRMEHFATKAAARAKVAAWIEDYNTKRRHSACQMMPPARYEQLLAAGEAA
jgi:hypothetical protein